MMMMMMMMKKKKRRMLHRRKTRNRKKKVSVPSVNHKEGKEQKEMLYDEKWVRDKGGEMRKRKCTN